MPWTTIVAGNTITASWANTNVRDQVVSQFSSTTERGNITPQNGMLSTLTTADATCGVYHYNGTSWRKPWNMPWGFQGIYNGSTNLTYTSTGDTTISVTSFPDVNNRRYRFTLSAQLVNTSAAQNQVTFALKRGSSSIYTLPAPVLAASETQMFSYTGYFTTTATATSTYTVNVAYLFGNGIRFDGTQSPNLLLIEDIGPSGAPV